jgi:class 3 adenylate cyclase
MSALLRFESQGLETAYRGYNSAKLFKGVATVCKWLILLYVVLTVVEVETTLAVVPGPGCGSPALSPPYLTILLMRLGLLGLVALVYAVVTSEADRVLLVRKEDAMLVLMLGRSALLIATTLVAESYCMRAVAPFEPWAIMWDVTFVGAVMALRVRFLTAAALVLVHIIASVVAWEALTVHSNEELQDTLGLLIVVFIVCCLTAYRRERINRMEFARLVSSVRDRRLRDELLQQMLPLKVRLALQFGRGAASNAAAQAQQTKQPQPSPANSTGAGMFRNNSNAAAEARTVTDGSSASSAAQLTPGRGTPTSRGASASAATADRGTTGAAQPQPKSSPAFLSRRWSQGAMEGSMLNLLSRSSAAVSPSAVAAGGQGARGSLFSAASSRSSFWGMSNRGEEEVPTSGRKQPLQGMFAAIGRRSSEGSLEIGKRGTLGGLRSSVSVAEPEPEPENKGREVQSEADNGRQPLKRIRTIYIGGKSRRLSDPRRQRVGSMRSLHIPADVSGSAISSVSSFAVPTRRSSRSSSPVKGATTDSPTHADGEGARSSRRASPGVSFAQAVSPSPSPLSKASPAHDQPPDAMSAQSPPQRLRMKVEQEDEEAAVRFVSAKLPQPPLPLGSSARAAAQATANAGRAPQHVGRTRGFATQKRKLIEDTLLAANSKGRPGHASDEEEDDEDEDEEDDGELTWAQLLARGTPPSTPKTPKTPKTTKGPKSTLSAAKRETKPTIAAQTNKQTSGLRRLLCCACSRRSARVADAAASDLPLSTTASLEAQPKPPPRIQRGATTMALSALAGVGSAGSLSNDLAGRENSRDSLGDDDDADDASNTFDPIAHFYPDVTVMFVYISDFADMTRTMAPTALVHILNTMHKEMDEVVQAHGVYKVMAIANMYLCVAGAPEAQEDHPLRMATAALAIMKLVHRRGREWARRAKAAGFRSSGRSHGHDHSEPAADTAAAPTTSTDTLSIQIGIHRGEVAAGVIGLRTLNWHIFGDTVNTASRMCSVNDKDCIQLTETAAAALRPFAAVRKLEDPAAAEDTSAVARPYILQERAPTFFKGKGVMSTAFLMDPELEALQSAARQRARKLQQQMQQHPHLHHHHHGKHADENQRTGFDTALDLGRRAIGAASALLGATPHMQGRKASGRALGTATSFFVRRGEAAPMAAQHQSHQREQMPTQKRLKHSASARVEKPSPSPALAPAGAGMAAAVSPGFAPRAAPAVIPPATTTTPPGTVILEAATGLGASGSMDSYGGLHISDAPLGDAGSAVTETMAATALSHEDDNVSISSGSSDESDDVEAAAHVLEDDAATLIAIQQAAARASALHESERQQQFKRKLSRAVMRSFRVPASSAAHSTATAHAHGNSSGNSAAPSAAGNSDVGSSVAIVVSPAGPPAGPPADSALVSPLISPASSVNSADGDEADKVIDQTLLADSIPAFNSHKMFLYFEAPLERRYAKSLSHELASISIGTAVIALMVAVALTLFWQGSNKKLPAGQTDQVLYARLSLIAVSLPCLVLALVFGACRTCRRGRSFAKHLNRIISWTLCLGFMIAINIVLPLVQWRAFKGDLVLHNVALVIACSLFELPVLHTLLVITADVVIFIACLATSVHYDADVFPSQVVMIVAVAFGTVTATYARERAQRYSFVVQQHADQQKRKCERLLLNMLPSLEHVERLMRGEPVVDTLEVPMLYSDIVGFTELSNKLGPESLIRMLDDLYSSFDAHLSDLGLYKVETIGDAFIAVGGLAASAAKNRAAANALQVLGDGSYVKGSGGSGINGGSSRINIGGGGSGHLSAPGGNSFVSQPFDPEDPSTYSPMTAIAIFAMRMLAEVNFLRQRTGLDVRIRVGLHTGRIVGGVVGTSRPRYFIFGEETVVANAMESSGVPGRIHVSQAAAVVLREEGYTLAPHTAETYLLEYTEGEDEFAPPPTPLRAMA